MNDDILLSNENWAMRAACIKYAECESDVIAYSMIPVHDAIDAILKIQRGIWEVDIPSPTVPEYIEHHEQMQELMKLCDSLIRNLRNKSNESRQGKWIIDDDPTVKGHCSVCGWESHYQQDDVVGMPFCPNCGAEMKKGETGKK